MCGLKYLDGWPLHIFTANESGIEHPQCKDPDGFMSEHDAWISEKRLFIRRFQSYYVDADSMFNDFFQFRWYNVQQQYDDAYDMI